MSDIAIDVRGLGKKYVIPGEQPAYRTLRDAVVSACVTPARRVLSAALGRSLATAAAAQEVWALRNVSFDVQRGEVLGIIGRNGSGKSTLLKILSRIAPPTTGSARVVGRVGSLLEVGTGFHFELSGRENVFLSGAMLGMRRAEIQRKFDEIVDFSQIGRYLDTPVKHYSSGMYMRLAFAVAAHLQSEILLVDEVLAVGDLEFQQKCLRKMREVTQSGRTVLFVAHNMDSIESLCDRALLLDAGQIQKIGRPLEVIADYIPVKPPAAAVAWAAFDAAPGNDWFRLRSASICGSDGRPTAEVDIADELQIRLAFWNRRPGVRYAVRIALREAGGACLLTSESLVDAGEGMFESRCQMPGHFLNNRSYTVGIEVFPHDDPRPEHRLRDETLLAFQALDREHGSTVIDIHSGLVRPPVTWRTDHQHAA